MKLWANNWIRWTVTPFAAAAGYALGYIAWQAVEGGIAFLSFVPFLPMILWIGPLISTYWSATWSINFALRCAPAHYMNVRWSVLIVMLCLQLLQFGIAFGAPPRQQGMQWLFFIESAGVVGWLFWETWHAYMAELRASTV